MKGGIIPKQIIPKWPEHPPDTVQLLDPQDIGRLADTADNYLATLELPMPDAQKLDSLRTGMLEISKALKELYVAVVGENPWR